MVDWSSPGRSPISLVNKIACRISALSTQIVELTSSNENYEKEIAELKKEVASRLKTTEKVTGEASDLHEKCRTLETELENLTVQHRVCINVRNMLMSDIQGVPPIRHQACNPQLN